MTPAKRRKCLRYILTSLTAEVVNTVDSASFFPLWRAVFPLQYVKNTFRNAEEMCKDASLKCPSAPCIYLPSELVDWLSSTAFGLCVSCTVPMDDIKLGPMQQKCVGIWEQRGEGIIKEMHVRFFSPASLCPGLYLPSLRFGEQRCNVREEGCIQAPSLVLHNRQPKCDPLGSGSLANFSLELVYFLKERGKLVIRWKPDQFTS